MLYTVRENGDSSPTEGAEQLLVYFFATCRLSNWVATLKQLCACRGDPPAPTSQSQGYPIPPSPPLGGVQVLGGGGKANKLVGGGMRPRLVDEGSELLGHRRHREAAEGEAGPGLRRGEDGGEIRGGNGLGSYIIVEFKIILDRQKNTI